ncbi:MAG: nucleotide sugar dehydrogenase, partial [DPANN group archaeon]|nr:nucleotide sugar dehydrogenase [DPANN group archaeon]
SLVPHLKRGQLVVIESTIYPGTTEEIVKPILESSGQKAGTDFFLAHCPERIDPGNRTWTLEKIPRVLGAVSREGAEKAAAFYRSIIKVDVLLLSSLKAAEATKIMENSFRDVNIAFINEMAMSFDKADIDVLEVIRGASTKPFGFMPHYPGCGVGGHCIPVDPYYLIEKAKSVGFDHAFLKLARKINNGMPAFTVALLEQALESKGLKKDSIVVGVYGLAYKADVDDIRESPSKAIIALLKEKGIPHHVFDPYISQDSHVDTLDALLEKCDVLLIVTDHKEIRGITPAFCKEKKIVAVIDGRNCLDKDAFRKSDIYHKGIGR